MHKILIATFSLITIATLTSGCGYRDKTLETLLYKKIDEAMVTRSESLLLTSIFGEKWEKICIQPPYIEADAFEKLIEKNEIKGFEYINDEYYTFWIFYLDGNYNWMRIKRIHADKHPLTGDICTDMKNPYLYLAPHSYSRKHPEKLKYYFSKEGNKG